MIEKENCTEQFHLFQFKSRFAISCTPVIARISTVHGISHSSDQYGTRPTKFQKKPKNTEKNINYLVPPVLNGTDLLGTKHIIRFTVVS